MSDKYLPDSFFQLINPDNTMSYNRFISHAIGSTETIIYFSLIAKMSYYHRNGMLDNEGFFYATALDIQESTAFTKRQQLPAINRLIEIGLISVKYAGLPQRKYYKVLNNQKLLLDLLEYGEKEAYNIRNKSKKSDKIQQLQNVTSSCSSENDEENATKPHNTQVLQNVTPRNDEMSQQEATKCNTSELQNVTPRGDKMSHKTKDNKSKVYNPKVINQSIDETDGQLTMEDMTDRTDRMDKSQTKDLLSERQRYEELIKQNIEYDYFTSYHEKGNAYSSAEIISEILTVIVDTVCSTASTIRVNGNDMPQEVVKATYLNLNSEHIEYVLGSMNNNSSDIKNIRSYLITTLYNAVTNINTHITSQCKADGVI